MKYSMINQIASFVNTCDGFQDCWEPFFRLFAQYAGPLRSLPVYLNTERAGFSFPRLRIIPTRVWPQSEPGRPTWSECLIRGLGAVAEPYVLYFQEDYFLKRPVEDIHLAAGLQLLQQDPGVGVVYLNEYGPQFRRSLPYGREFVQICDPASYRVSTQAAIWRKEFLLSVICPWESGWTFEKFASLRVRRFHRKLISLDPIVMRTAPAVDYIYTGVIKGKWKRECVELFRTHGINVDFSQRGFYRESGRLKTRCEVFRKAVAQPSALIRSLVSLVQH